jgi:hypothetical protein
MPPQQLMQSVQALEKEIRAWIADWNTHPKPFVWKKTAEEILDSLDHRKRLSPATAPRATGRGAACR